MNLKMSNYWKLIARVTVTWAVLITTILCFVPTASAVTQNLQFNSPKGYTVKTSFSYDAANTDAIALKDSLGIAEHGAGKTNVLDSLKVSFYDPVGKAIASYDNIVNGVVRGDYFEFNYDPATQQLTGELDLGGESIGEMYLKSEANGDLSLIWIEESGEEQIIDTVSRDGL